MLLSLMMIGGSFQQVLLVVGALVAIGIVTSVIVVTATRRSVSTGRKRTWFSWLLYIAFLVSVVVLAATSFGAILLRGQMGGESLHVHVGIAGAFVFLLLAIAWLYLPAGPADENADRPADMRWWLARWSVWGLVLSGLAAEATMFLSMLPAFDTTLLLQAAEWHRYAGLAVVAFAVVHAYSLICIRLGLR